MICMGAVAVICMGAVTPFKGAVRALFDQLCLGGWQCFVWEAGSDLAGRLAVLCVGGWQ